MSVLLFTDVWAIYPVNAPFAYGKPAPFAPFAKTSFTLNALAEKGT